MNAPDRNTYAALAALALACAMTLVHAAPADASLTSPDALRAAARQALLTRAEAQGRRIDVTVPDLDPRLRLAACTQPLETQIAGDGELHDYTSVAIRCSGAVRWTIYVRAGVSAETTVLTARGAMARGRERPQHRARHQRVRANLVGVVGAGQVDGVGIQPDRRREHSTS